MFCFGAQCRHEITRLDKDGVKRCLRCKYEFCSHPEIDPFDGCCTECGDYIQEITMEKSFVSKGIQNKKTTKNISDHAAYLQKFHYRSDMIEKTLKLFSSIGCTKTFEKGLLVVCLWMAYSETDTPFSLKELATIHKVKIGHVKDGRKLAFAKYPEYTLTFINVAQLIHRVFDKFIDYVETKFGDEIDKDEHIDQLVKVAKFCDENKHKADYQKKSSSFNVAIALLYLYTVNNSQLKKYVATCAQKDEFSSVLGSSKVTTMNICKNILLHLFDCVIK